MYKKLVLLRDWPDHYIKRLKGYPYHSLRVGDYRVILLWIRRKDVIWVVAVGDRDKIYSDLDSIEDVNG